MLYEIHGTSPLKLKTLTVFVHAKEFLFCFLTHYDAQIGLQGQNIVVLIKTGVKKKILLSVTGWMRWVEILHQKI